MPELAEAPVFDVEQLRGICMDDAELMREVVTTLVDDSRVQISALVQAVEQADANKCARLAHYVKGACANVGAASLAALMKSIEVSAKAGDFKACRTWLQGVPAALEKFSFEASSL